MKNWRKVLKSLGFHLPLLLLFLSCSHQKRVKYTEPISWETFSTVPRWFDTPQRYSLDAQNNNVSYHPFFDFPPMLDRDKRTGNVYILSQKGRSARYGLDMLSGKKYFQQKVCLTKDIWEKYPLNIHKLPFYEAILPRFFGKRGDTQKVFLFTPRQIKQNLLKEYTTVRVVLLGAIEIEHCLTPPCQKQDRWKKEVILIATPTISGYQNLKQLLHEENEAFIRAYIENYLGYTRRGERLFGATRVHRIWEDWETWDFLLQGKRVFSFRGLKKIQKSCFALYDQVWKTLVPSIKEGKREEFYKKLKGELDTHHERLYTCMKTVNPGHLHENFRRHWFFTYLQGFNLLRELGHRFDCHGKTWRKDHIPRKWPRRENFFQEAWDEKKCDEDDLTWAFETVPLVFGYLYHTYRETYRYITYDWKSNGTHEKIYSWVYESSLYQSCMKKLDRGHGGVLSTDDQILKGQFPLDISWIFPVKKRYRRFIIF